MSIVRRIFAGVVAAVLAVGIVAPVAGPAVAAPDDAEFILTKTVDPNNSPYAPGDQFSYTIELTCNSNLVDTCVNAELTDTLPAPLVFDPTVNPPVVVIGGGTSSVAVDGTNLTVDFTSTGSAGTGQPAGSKATVTVFVTVPQDISADVNDQDIVNTVNATGDNALPKDASSTITIEVPEILDSTVSKSVDDHQDDTAPGVPALPGQPVDYTIGGGNASNRSVDEIVVQDPADGVASPFDGYFDYTGITSITPPAGADQVQIEWLDENGVWHVAYGPGPIPGDPSTIPDGVPFEDVKGMKFTFSSSTGAQLPPSGDQPAEIGIGAVTNDTVNTIAPEQSVEVPNTASSNVVVNDTPSTPKTAPGDVVISNTGPFVDVTKTFAKPNLLAGEQTTATITAANGFRPVTEMVIQEPTPGAPNLADQGLEFAGFTDGVVWPPNATGASVTYTYADGTTETISTTTPNTLPDPTQQDSSEVVGFIVTFTGPIISNARAEVPFTVTALPVDDADVTSTNETTSTVTDQTGKSGDDEDSADITRQPGRVSTVVSKNIARDEVWAVPGTTTDVSFDAKVNDEGANASTIGADELIVSDPADPRPGDPVEPFWNTFDLSQIVVGVPANADLQIEYWDGQTWQTLPGGQLDGEGTLVLAVDSGTAPVTREMIEGIRFVYTPKAGEQLPPGFHVVPTITVETRDEFRDGSGSVADAAAAEDPLNVANTASSTVVNPDDQSPEDNTATDGDDIDLRPIDGGGDGPDLFEKNWIVDPADPLFAFSEDQRTVRLSWSTEGLPFDTVALSDDPTAGADFDDAAIAQSAFDAWDLVAIAPIDASLDPSMQYDRVSKVELFEFDEAAGTGQWVDVTAEACADAAACDGAFPGYTLSADERETTRAVRLTYAEGSNRGDGTGPAAGTGVAASYDHSRNLDLVFELRDFKRSDGGAVTGTLHDETFNSGQAGVVNNTAEIFGDGPEPVDQTDSDLITIIDTTVNTSVTKTFDQDSLPIPPVGTPAGSYPLVNATITAKNETEASVQTLRITDPAPGSATDAYEYLNLVAIDSISVPADATESTVTLTREGGAIDPPISIDAALALTPADLADVIGVSVLHTDPDDVAIRTTETSSVVLTYQLRATERTSGAAVTTTDFATNVAGSEVTRPGDDPELDHAGATASDVVTFVDATYDVEAQKSIESPAGSANSDSRVEDESPDGYTITLQGQPTGNVRTTVLTMTDASATFWNAFEFAGFPLETLPPNLHQLRVSALTGVEFVEDAGTGELSYTCNGSATLDGCWTTGDWQQATGTDVQPELPAGVSAADVRGLRFEVRVDDAASNWENPINPVVIVKFTANQLENLHYGPNGEVDTVPVPSTRPGQPLAPGETVAGTTTDTVDVHGDGSWEGQGGTPWEGDDDATDTTQLLHLQNGIKVVKTPGNGQGGAASQQFPPSAGIPYKMTITNTGQWPMTGLELTDQVATDANGSLLIARPNVDPTFSFALTAADGTVLDASGFSGELDEQTGVVTITVPDGFVFNPGDVLVISAALQFRPGLAPGTPVGNTISATSDRTFDTCESTSFGTVTNPTTTVVDDCASNTTVNPTAAAPVAIVKAVKGAGAGVPGAQPGDANYDDLGVLNHTGTADGCAEANGPVAGFYRNNCVPITRPGGLETWLVGFENLGNIPIESIAGIDVLPAVGDTGVTVGTSRGSEWSPIFVGNVVFPGDPGGAVMTTSYMTTVPDRACNAKDIEWSAKTTPMPTTDPCFADVSTRAWIEFDAGTALAEIAQAKAIKVVVTWPGEASFAPGQSGALTFQTRTPLSNPAAVDGGLPIAWNAVAGGSRADYNGAEVYQGPVEPVRSGVAVPTGEIALQKEVDVPADWPDTFPLPDSYDFDVQCTSGGESVNLVDGSGQPAPPATVPADGTVVDYGTGTDLPIYSDCTVQEVPSQGSTVTYDPADAGDPTKSGSIRAKRDLSGLENVHHGAPADGELAQVTATNTYELGGFYLLKEVTGGGAVDQDGEPIEFDPVFEFTASCIFLGEEVIRDADRTFTLKDGDLKTFNRLPVGAECTVVETDAGGATDTTMIVDETPGEPQPVEGDTAEFEIKPDVDNEHVTTVAAVNNYTVGSISVTKDVTGSGAAGAADTFEVQLVCTWAEATTNPVYDATHTIADGETWAVDNLPTGAECTVSEPDDGGATQAIISPDQPVTIGVAGEEGDPIEVTVTNDYRLGGFDIAKTVSGAGAGFSEGVDFEFTYVCSYADEIVGQGTLTITGDGTAGPLTSATVTGLPVGTQCIVTETDGGGVDALPDPVTVTIPDEADGIAQVVTAEVDNHFSAGTVSVTKELAGEASEDPDFVDASYTVHVTCSLTDGGAPLFDGDVVVTGGQTVTVTDPATGDPLLLPLGTHCWGDETDDAGATSSSVDFDSFDNAVVVEASDGDEPQQLAITATNTFDLADLVIEKVLDGDAASYAEDKTFEILVTCTLDRGPGNDPVVSYDQEPVELQGGEQATLTDIPIGSDCYAEEPDGQGAWEIRISATADDPVTVDGGETPITITVTNVYPDAGFSVTKDVDDGGAVNQDGEPIETLVPYRFAASCVFEGETVLDEEFQLRDGEVKTFTGLPAGAVCTVEETETRGSASTSIVVTQNGVDDDLGEATSAEFTLEPDVDDQQVTVVAVTNHYTVGSVEIVKSVTGTGADAWGGTFGDFDVRLLCVLPGTTQFVVYDDTHTLTKDAPGDVWLVPNLPTNATCMVTEVDDGGATESTVTPRFLVVGDDETDEPVEVDIVNDFRTGALNVLKRVAGPGAPAFSEGEFTFQVVCTYEGETVVDQELVIESDGGEGPFTSETITGIPVDAECVVTETDQGNADEPAAPVTVTIPDQAEEGVETVVTAGFVNEFSLGTVELTKEVDGDAADAEWVVDEVFTVQVTCQLEVDGAIVTLYDAPVEITGGETVEIVDAEGNPVQLPLGTHCFGVETDDGGATASSVDFGSYDDAAIVVESDTAQRLTLTATNTFDSGSLELEKTVSGAVDQADGKTFEIELTCVFDRGGNEQFIALDETVAITAGETKAFDDLPVGAECWAEETEAGGAVAVTVSATEANPAVVGADEAVTITVDNRFDPPIASTGVDGERVALWIGGALLLVGAGAAVLLIARRRRRSA
ncbi:DUF5979 domain-containing protein [Agromyces sp. NPDC058136]|uniref:DUF5979 domain-containing protein n=1 Tax=Agromyces sp. NPDC058136 TaxID=3346354 RepID=UPI0036D7EE0E